MGHSTIIEHEVIALISSFEDFTSRLEALAGKFDPSVEIRINQDPEWVKEEIGKMAGEQDLMIFEADDHGLILKIFGIYKKAIQYHIGNPLIAASMNKEDLRAALYAPLRILVYESADGVCYVEYDLPSTQFGQFKNGKIREVGLSLDSKIDRLIALADQA